MKHKKIVVRLNDIGLFLFLEDVIFPQGNAYFFRRHISAFISQLHVYLTHLMYITARAVANISAFVPSQYFYFHSIFCVYIVKSLLNICAF
jgi:hypothetical protein